MDEYEDILELIKNSDDSLWPDWLFKPSFNNFNDNYYNQSFADDDSTSKVKKLKRRYGDFFEYMDAMAIYNEYMERLVQKYGSMRVIRNSMELGTLDEAVPSKPKLKNNRKNKRFLQSGILPSRKLDGNRVPNEEMFAIARQIFPNSMGDDIPLHPGKMTKEQKRRYAEIQKTFEGESRRRNMYRSVSNNRGTDFIVEYLNQMKHGVYDSSGVNNGNNNRSIIDIRKEMEREENTRPEILQAEEEDRTIVMNGRLVRQSDRDKTDLYKILYQEGFDILHNLGRSGMNKKSVKLIRAEIGATEPMTKKELKKMKRKARKDREKIQRKADSNRLLESILLNNKLDGGTRDENGDISFRLRDVFPD